MLQREPALAPDGSTDMRITYDHRVLDACTIARALVELERVLTHEILENFEKARKLKQRTEGPATS